MYLANIYTISDSNGDIMLKYMKINKVFEIEGFYSAIRFSWNEDFVFSGESHPFWEVVFVESGTVEVTEDENVYLLSGGDLILHAPNEFHRIKSAQGSCPCGFIFSFFASGELPEYLKSGVFTPEPSLLAQYRNICDKVHRFYHSESESFDGQELGSLLGAFLIKLGASRAKSGSSMAQSAMEYRRIVSFMLQNVDRSLTLADIARENNISISYVKLLFDTYVGISPKKYLNQLRLRRASELLMCGLSVADVANRMNFSSPNYFSAFYKKHTGISPSDKQRG
jgi:AraC-like DNA-binding protein